MPLQVILGQFRYKTEYGRSEALPVLRRINSINCTQTCLIALPLSLRKSAIVLWSGASRPVSHMTSTSRPPSRSSRRLD